ncbi:MAG: TauD/TfdA family dioxygenase [Pseudomonadaceae bacterium]|nr:TauD/TfdA family dioxygenase [Pseudomonadaceae bacterium]
MQPSSYRRFADQAAHYFARPHSQLPDGPVINAACWRGQELAQASEQWLVTPSAVQLQELHGAARQLSRNGRTLVDVNRTDAQLDSWQPEFARWRQTLANGCGVVVVRGIPVDQLSQREAEMAFWLLGQHLGVPGGQNPEQELLGHVMDYHEEDANPLVRRYRTTGDIDFHCDAADVVGLLCLRPAAEGGLSRIASSVQIFNDLQAEDPLLAAELFLPQALDSRGEEKPGATPFRKLPLAAYDGEVLRTFYHSDYFRSALRHSGVKRSDTANAMFDRYDELADANALDMELQAGDIQLISNHTVVHARTGYQDDPSAPRHLLRLWLSLE